MRPILFALSLAFSLPLQASPVFNIQEMICAGELTSFGDSLLCGGNLSLRGGTIYSDLAIFIRAGGILSMNDLDIRATSVVLKSELGLFTGGDVSIESQSILFEGGAWFGDGDSSSGVTISVGEYTAFDPRLGGVQVIGPGSNIPVVWGGVPITPVPEPSICGAILAGFVMFGWKRRKDGYL